MKKMFHALAAIGLSVAGVAAATALPVSSVEAQSWRDDGPRYDRDRGTGAVIAATGGANAAAGRTAGAGVTIAAGAATTGVPGARRASPVNMTARVVPPAMSIRARRATIPTIPAAARAIAPAIMSGKMVGRSAADRRSGCGSWTRALLCRWRVTNADRRCNEPPSWHTLPICFAPWMNGVTSTR